MANSTKRDIEFRTSSADSVPEALRGNLYWYDTGTTENDEKVYYDNATSTYAYWNDGTSYIISAVADVGGIPTDYFIGNPTLTSDVIVSGAGDVARNGLYEFIDADAGTAFYVKDGVPTQVLVYIIHLDEWEIKEFSEPAVYTASGGEYHPPKSTWTSVSPVDDPAPTLAFTDLSGTDFSGVGAWSGALSVSANVLADAWYRAETTAFESLRNYAGYEENDNCFRGFLPVMGDGDDLKSKDVWMFTSGGSGEFDTERLSSNNALWCSLRSDARIESIWSKRSDAMKFAGLVEAWLKETNNLNETGNISWVNMVDIPAEPEIYRTDGKIRKRLWQQTINLELIYKTENVFD